MNQDEFSTLARIPSRIIFPQEGVLRARKVILRSNHGHVYKFPSTKNNRHMHLEYSLERDRAQLLEVDPYVKWYKEQPFRIEYEDEGKEKKMFPDFLVARIDDSLTVEEIKPYDKANDPDIKRRFAIEKKLLEQDGYLFEVHTEKEIRGGFKLENAKKLLPLRTIIVNPLLKADVRDLLMENTLTGTEIIDSIPDLSEKMLLAMLAKGQVFAALTEPLSLATQYFLV